MKPLMSPVNDAERARNEDGNDADQNGDAAAGDDAAEDIAAELIGAERISDAILINETGRLEAGAEISAQRVLRRNYRSKKGEQYDEGNDGGAGHADGTLEQG